MRCVSGAPRYSGSEPTPPGSSAWSPLLSRSSRRRDFGLPLRSSGKDTDRQSPHPSPGVQLTGGNRQIRTTVPPLARGVTPVIAGVEAG